MSRLSVCLACRVLLHIVCYAALIKLPFLTCIGPDSIYSLQVSSLASSRASSQASSGDRTIPAGPGVRPTIHLRRSQSDGPVQSPSIYPQQTAPPCITAYDMNNDDIRRNISSDTLTTWDKAKNPVIPVAQMVGFGRYRRAAGASPEFVKTLLKKQTSELEHLDTMVANLDMSDIIASPNSEYHAATSEGYRRNSGISMRSTASDASRRSRAAAANTEYVDSATRVIRGFCPPPVDRSPRNMMHTRKGSNLSIMSLPSDAEYSPTEIPLKRTSTLLNERRDSVPLTTINEVQTEPRTKVQRACVFPNHGNQDSAVASDDEDYEEWVDVSETKSARVSNMTKMFKEGKGVDIQPQPQPPTGLTRVRTTSNDKKRGRGSTVTLDRNRTIRATRPDLKRRNSKNKAGHERVKSDEKKNAQEQIEEGASLPDTSPGALELYVANPIKEQLKHQPAKKRSR